jgi:hypothetical protein
MVTPDRFNSEQLTAGEKTDVKCLYVCIDTYTVSTLRACVSFCICFLSQPCVLFRCVLERSPVFHFCSLIPPVLVPHLVSSAPYLVQFILFVSL